MPDVERLRHRPARDRRDHADQHGPRRTAAERGAHLRITHGHVGPRGEHHQRETHIGEEDEDRIGGVEDAETSGAEDDSRDHLAEQHRQVQLLGQSQQRPDQPERNHQRQGREGHGIAAILAGTSMFSSAQYSAHTRW